MTQLGPKSLLADLRPGFTVRIVWRANISGVRVRCPFCGAQGSPVCAVDSSWGPIVEPRLAVPHGSSAHSSRKPVPYKRNSRSKISAISRTSAGRFRNQHIYMDY
ncbi:hypothetical protein Bbelb_046970 [Branchiostoma belcheri]|nr:hypothetical protein Bbelb_046970 [Branchiostoma belcheri]